MRFIVGLLSLSSLAMAQPRPLHTGELLYQLKEKYREEIHQKGSLVQVLKPQGLVDLEQIRRNMLDSGRYEFVAYNTYESTDFDEYADKYDPEFEKQWQHEKIATKQAWQTTQGVASVTVAVCDSGVEKHHEDLKGRVLSNGWDFIDSDNDANPVTSHGTFVAGLIAANADNKLGGAGVSPNVRILPLRITNSKGGTTMKIIAECIQYAADQGAKVINVSFTGIQNPVVETAGKYARSKGALLVYSAGNQGMERADWPDYPHVLAVGATSIDDTLWSWYRNIFKKGGSNFGHFIDIVAPGHNVTSTTTYISHNPGGDKYRKGSGTSYSAPIVSGVAALIFSVNPKLGPEQVEQILLESAQPLGDEYYYGAGQVNAHRAVQMAWETI